MKSEKVRKAIFCVLALVLVSVALFYSAGFIFMRIFNLPVEQCRPWTILQYWMLYQDCPSKFIRITVNFCFLLPWIVLIGGAAFLVFHGKRRALHGAARFANSSEIRQAGLIDPAKGLEKTILVGKYKEHYLSYGGYQFVLLAAPTRSGKGVGIVVPNCLNYSDSLVVLDIKGENFDITSGFRKSCGQEVFLFSPYDEEGRTHRYNPLDYIREDPAERLGDIDAIGQALYSGESNNDKFWSENAKDFFRGVCLFVLESPQLPKTLGEILRQASGKGKPVKEHLLGKLQEAQQAGRPYSSNCVDALNRVLSNSDNTLAGIVATFNTALLSFQNPKVDLATSASDFDLREVRRKQMSIYFKIEPTKLKDAKVLINLFFDQLLNLNTRKLPTQDKSLKYQCLVLLDEMTSIGTVNMIKQAVSYMAGYNMRLLTIIQNKSQLEDVYGKAGAVTLLSNHALMIMYAPSPATQSDANEYSEMLGYQTVKSKSRSMSKGGGSTSESDQRRALMLPQEIRELGSDNEIVTLENTKPIFCQKIRYYKDPVFTERANWAVPDIPIQDVALFVAKLEQRIREATDEELSSGAAANSIVVGETSLPEELKKLPDSEWGEEQIENYLDNLMNNSIPKSISNFEALSTIDSSKVAENLGTLQKMNEQAALVSDSEANEDSETDDALAKLIEEDESDESEETSEVSVLSEAESQDDLIGVLSSLGMSEDVPEIVTVQAQIEESSSAVEESEKSIANQETGEAADKRIEATVNATVKGTDWNEDRCAEFVAGLIEHIRNDLVPFENLKKESTEAVENEGKTESNASQNFKDIQKIRNSYRKVSKRSLRLRPSA